MVISHRCIKQHQGANQTCTRPHPHPQTGWDTHGVLTHLGQSLVALCWMNRSFQQTPGPYQRTSTHHQWGREGEGEGGGGEGEGEGGGGRGRRREREREGEGEGGRGRGRES